MTTSKAIRMLTRIKDRINFEVTDSQAKMDALNMAIKALTAQPETCVYWDRESNICALHRPSAERKKGKWIDACHSLWDGATYWYRECNQCGYKRADNNPDKDTKFCPNCGARMVKGDESDADNNSQN